MLFCCKKKKDKEKEKRRKAKDKARAKVRTKGDVKPKGKARAAGTPGRRAEPAGAKKKPGPGKAPAVRTPAPAPTREAPSATGPPQAATSKPAPTAAKRSHRKGSSLQRRGLDGRPFSPGGLLLPSGPQDRDEILYLFRGCVAAERRVTDEGVAEVIVKGGAPDNQANRAELQRTMEGVVQRFDGGSIEPHLPSRPAIIRRTFASVVERARHRRREIGAFLRGLDLGDTETSHMDPHGEGSLQNLMEWAARLEILTDADEPEQADYTQFHRVLDQLEINTEALVVDVELTLRRTRDRLLAR